MVLNLTFPAQPSSLNEPSACFGVLNVPWRLTWPVAAPPGLRLFVIPLNLNLPCLTFMGFVIWKPA